VCFRLLVLAVRTCARPKRSLSQAARWRLGLALLLKIGIAFGAIFNGRIATSVADGIPIDSYTQQGILAMSNRYSRTANHD
jgi:cytochrome bd-type quinol oxidase subunit 2